MKQIFSKEDITEIYEELHAEKTESAIKMDVLMAKFDAIME